MCIRDRHYHDQEVLNDLYQVAKCELDQALVFVNHNGQLVLQDEWPVFIDWSQEFDKSTCAQAVLIYALKQFLFLAAERKDHVEKYQVILEKLVNFSNKYLFDKAEQLFISGQNREINIASQVWMALAKVLPAEKNHKLMSTTLQKLFPIKEIATPYMYHYIVAALFETDHKKEAIKLIKNYWGNMIKYGADTFWEAFQPEKPEFSPYNLSLIHISEPTRP